MYRTSAQLILGFTLLATPTGLAMDWPQWRGAHRDGKSDETGLLQSWPEEGPRRVWTAEGVGRGFSSLSIANGRVFTLGDFGDTQQVIAINIEDGTIQWTTAIGPSWTESGLYPGSRSTPTTDGDRVYALGTEGRLVCLNATDGAVVWQREIRRDFGGFMMMARAGVNWRYTESPLIDGKWVLVTPGAKDAAVVALDKQTGDEIWRSAIPDLGDRGNDGAAYSSLVVSHGAGVKQYVQLMGRGLVGVRASDGQFLWGYNGIANDVANIATPIVSGDWVFGSTGYRTGAVLLELTPSSNGVKATEKYFLPPTRFQNHHGGVILHNGHLYTGTGHNKGFPVSVRLSDGELAWGPVRNDGRDSAAIAYADGRLYFRYQNGLMLLVEATPESYREHGSFRIPEVNDPSWSHPVISEGRLFLREQDRVYCYDVRVSS